MYLMHEFRVPYVVVPNPVLLLLFTSVLVVLLQYLVYNLNRLRVTSDERKGGNCAARELFLNYYQR